MVRGERKLRGAQVMAIEMPVEPLLAQVGRQGYNIDSSERYGIGGVIVIIAHKVFVAGGGP